MQISDLQQWDELKRVNEELLDEKTAKKVREGFCVKCPIPRDDLCDDPPVRAVRRWRNMQPMCERHYQEVVSTITAIIGRDPRTEREKQQDAN